MSNSSLRRASMLVGGFLLLVVFGWWTSLLVKEVFLTSPIEGVLQYNYDTSYRGIVVDKYVDKRDHAYEKIILDSGDEVVMPAGHEALYNEVSVGDSLYKTKGSYFGYLKSDSVITAINYEKWLRENFREELE